MNLHPPPPDPGPNLYNLTAIQITKKKLKLFCLQLYSRGGGLYFYL